MVPMVMGVGVSKYAIFLCHTRLWHSMVAMAYKKPPFRAAFRPFREPYGLKGSIALASGN